MPRFVPTHGVNRGNPWRQAVDVFFESGLDCRGPQVERCDTGVTGFRSVTDGMC